jgi:hypothetical protein
MGWILGFLRCVIQRGTDYDCAFFGTGQETNQGGGFLFALSVHSLHIVIVARDGKLIANLEGNEFTAQQFATCSRQFWIPPGIEPPKRSSRGVRLTQRVPALNSNTVTL